MPARIFVRQVEPIRRTETPYDFGQDTRAGALRREQRVSMPFTNSTTRRRPTDRVQRAKAAGP